MKPAVVLLVAAAAWAQVPVETVALGTTAERPAVSQAVMTDLEKQLDKRVSMVGGNDPIQLLGLARGVYVKGFGVVITQEISLVQTPFPNPFRQSITPLEAAPIHKRKLERLPLVRQTVHQLWMVAAAALNTMPDNDQIVVALRLLYQEWEDTKGLPGLLVVKATRRDGLAGNLQTGEQ